jgi:hypothetical protein
MAFMRALDRESSGESKSQSADQHYLEEGINILEMARDAQRLFDNEQPMEKTAASEFRCFELHAGERRA